MRRNKAHLPEGCRPRGHERRYRRQQRSWASGSWKSPPPPPETLLSTGTPRGLSPLVYAAGQGGDEELASTTSREGMVRRLSGTLVLSLKGGPRED